MSVADSIIIRRESGAEDRADVLAAFGAYVVHEALDHDDQWSVTHKPSGIALAHYDTQSAAEMVAGLLGIVVPTLDLKQEAHRSLARRARDVAEVCRLMASELDAMNAAADAAPLKRGRPKGVDHVQCYAGTVRCPSCALILEMYDSGQALAKIATAAKLNAASIKYRLERLLEPS